ncbi:ATPase [Sphingobacteriales bacterium UPWRP_1]|nr:hypothetical protein BVG80_08540 [Sphingobacteriales bacterium TSM_CSM]PSJ78475.1 ATPase [Sphingobacteriales bacterium UPWRP_1]
MTIKEQIAELLKALNKGVYEKENEMKLALLSAIAGESIFMLGAPGVAKSLIARRLKFAFKNATAFEYLMSRFSTPDEIFGPVSISKLKDEDKYERIVKNYLPSAHVVFLDEIWKAGPSIQNALLTVLNEKVYRNGDQEVKVPMKALISASNELPASDQGLEALWDRFLVRYVVEGIKEVKNFNEMIANSFNIYEDNVPEEIKLTEEIYTALQEAIDKVEIPENVFGVIHAIRNYINTYNQQEENKDRQIYVSDRRWRKIIHLLRTSALLNDRTSVDLMDCFLICHCLWNEPEQRSITEQFVKDAVQKHGYKLNFNLKTIKETIADLKAEVTEETKFVKDTRVETLKYIKEYDCYEIEGVGEYDKYLRKQDLEALNGTEQYIYLHYSQHSSFYRHSQFRIRKGSDNFHIIVNGKECVLKTEIIGDKRQITRKPNKVMEKHWDEKVAKILETTSGLKEQLETYRQMDLKHLRVNLFVDPALANIVETHITDKRKAIEKLEVEVKSIQSDYKALKDGEVVIPPPKGN